MRTLFTALALAVGLAGCTLFQQEPVALPTTQTLPAAGQKAQSLIREAHLAIAAAAGVIKQNVEAKVWTPDQAQGYQDRLEKARERLLQARQFLGAGQFDLAQAEAQILDTLIRALQAELARKATP